MDETRAIIQKELSQGERLLWNGKPRTNLRFPPHFISTLFTLGILMLYMTLYSSYKRSTFKSRLDLVDFQSFFAMLFLAALGMIIVDALRRLKTFYGVTNERLIIITTLFRRTVRSINLGSVPKFLLQEQKMEQEPLFFTKKASLTG